jgi:hypothetical protein
MNNAVATWNAIGVIAETDVFRSKKCEVFVANL